ncbi:MAG: hypothetical protein EXS10_00460 [Phycisphaerales bacterium]|nr:hypothetical protein [Phycisphaerales bacterium]
MLSTALLLCLHASAQLDAVAEDRYSVVLPKATAASGDISAFVPPVPASTHGRVLLFLLDETPRLRGLDPSDGPFLTHPSPIASMEVTELREGVSVDFDRSKHAMIASFPPATDAICNGFDRLNGRFRVQAVFDCASANGVGHLRAGNLLSNVVDIDLNATRMDQIELQWEVAIEPTPLPTTEGVEWVSFKSESLSKAAGRDVFHRAGVALPREYHNIDAPRRTWPAVYLIPEQGATQRAALDIAPALQSEYLRTAFPQAVWICLDPNGAFGHHAFVESEANGPVTQALVQEFIPYLEQKYRLVAQPQARVLTGNGLGGFTCLWLLLRAPDVFSQAFVSSPEPVSMSHFGLLDLGREKNAFTDAAGEEIAVFRGILGPKDDRVYMTVRDAIGMEYAMHPQGDSGGRFDTFNSMFCAVDAATAAPRRLIDPQTGAVDRSAATEYLQYDIVEALAANPARFGPILADRAHILIGARDSNYAQFGVALLKKRLEAWEQETKRRRGSGSIEILPQRDRDAVITDARLRFGFAINDWFRSQGLADALPNFDPKQPFRTPGVDAPIPGMKQD